MGAAPDPTVATGRVAWARRTTRHPDRPAGDPYALAAQVASSLPAAN